MFFVRNIQTYLRNLAGSSSTSEQLRCYGFGKFIFCKVKRCLLYFTSCIKKIFEVVCVSKFCNIAEKRNFLSIKCTVLVKTYTKFKQLIQKLYKLYKNAF